MEEPEVEGDELDARLCTAGGRAVRLGAAVQKPDQAEAEAGGEDPRIRPPI
jgi:hypothetical protein